MSDSNIELPNIELPNIELPMLSPSEDYDYNSNIVLQDDEEDKDYEIVNIVEESSIDSVKIEDEVVSPNVNYEKLNLPEIRSIIKEKYYSKFKSSFTSALSRTKKKDLVDFLNNKIVSNSSLSNVNVDNVKLEQSPHVKLEQSPHLSPHHVELRVVEKSDYVENLNANGSYIYDNLQEDLDKIKNNKKIKDDVNPYKSTENEKIEDLELENIKNQISIYFERFAWLKSTSFNNKINDNPQGLLDEIRCKVNCKNTTSLVRNQFFLTLHTFEDLNEKYGQGYIKSKNFTYLLERNEAFKDCLDQIGLEYSNEYGASLTPEKRLMFIMATTLLSVHVFNTEEEERKKISNKDVKIKVDNDL